MPKKERKKSWRERQRERQSWKERQRDRQLRQQRAQEAYQIQRKPSHWPKGKILVAFCLIVLMFVAYGAWQYSIQISSTYDSGTTPSTSPSTPSTPQSTVLAPNFRLKDINGTLFSLTQFKGRVIIIHFMVLAGCSAYLNPINENQLRELGTVYDKYCGKKPVTMVTVGVATCAGCDTILAQIRDYYNITWALGNDYDDQKLDIIDAYTKYSIQDGTIVLVDQKSNVAQVYTNVITAATLSLKIDQLLLV